MRQRQISPDRLQFLPCGIQQLGSQLSRQLDRVAMEGNAVLGGFYHAGAVQDSECFVEFGRFCRMDCLARVRIRDHLKRHGEPVTSAVETRIPLPVDCVHQQGFDVPALEVVELRQLVPGYPGAQITVCHPLEDLDLVLPGAADLVLGFRVRPHLPGAQ